MFNYPKPVLAIVAYSGTGKTTLLEKVIPILTKAGYRIATIKHSHHDFEIDKIGKDSDRLRKAGASQVLITSKYRSALIKERDGKTEPEFENEINQLDHSKLDLVLVEGFRNMDIAKIEVHRSSLKKPLLCEHDDNILALICDTPPQNKPKIPTLPLNDIKKINDFIVSFIEKA